jgi:RNA polymerase sigma-70 factor (ECF subfamily)
MESLQAVMDPLPQPSAAPGQLTELERLFREHHATVMRAAYRITGNSTDAEDVLQSVFMRLLSRRADSVVLENVPAYLQRSAVNAALDLVRARHDGKHLSIDEHAPHLAASGDAAPDRQQEAREMRELVRRAIANLAPRTAEIFAMHYFEGYSNPQIAEMLDLTPAGVAVTLHRARTQLLEEVRSYLGGSYMGERS